MTNEIHANLVTLVNIYLKMARDPVITNLRYVYSFTRRKMARAGSYNLATACTRRTECKN